MADHSFGKLQDPPPKIESDWSFTDPDIAVRIYNPAEKYADEADEYPVGCYFNIAYNIEEIGKVRGQTPDEAWHSYARLLAAGFISGELAMYGEDVFAVPYGMRFLGPPCPYLEGKERIDQSRQYMLDNFDEILRRAGAQGKCTNPTSLVDGFQPQMEPLNNAGLKNVWFFMEMFFISVAAGWHEGSSATEKGLPRPPLCRY